MKALLVISCLTACATDPLAGLDCADCDGKADGTNPTGHLAGLTVNAPSGTVAAKIFAHRSDSTTVFELQPGFIRGVQGGTYCVYTQVGQVMTRPDCTIAIPQGTNVTYSLGAVTFVHGANELIAGIDIPFTSNLCPHPVPLAAISGPIPHPVGSYAYTPCSPIDDTYQYKAMPLISFDVSALATTTVDVTNSASHYAIRLLPSTGRTLPDVTGTTLLFETATSADIPLEWTAYAVHDRPLVFFDEPELWWFDRYAGFLAGTEISLGSTVQLRRIDLNHARVTLPDNTVSIVPGTATIELVMDANNLAHTNEVVLDNHATGYGLDVLPGVYRVTTTFLEPTDPPMNVVDVETLDLRF